MATLMKDKLYNIYVGKSCASGIEAKSLTDAIHNAPIPIGIDEITGMTTKPIYRASIGLECDGREILENAVYDILIKGTDEKVVDMLRNAIACAIGGLAVKFNGLRIDGSSDNGKMLQSFIAENGVTVFAI